MNITIQHAELASQETGVMKFIIKQCTRWRQQGAVHITVTCYPRTMGAAGVREPQTLHYPVHIELPSGAVITAAVLQKTRHDRYEWYEPPC